MPARHLDRYTWRESGGPEPFAGKTAAGSLSEAKRSSDVSGGSHPGSGEVGTFSWERWGIDTLLVIGAFIGGGWS